MPDHIFISYAHIDNEPYGDTKGWIDRLFERLQVRLAQVLGSEPVIWWDKRLQGDQYFAGVIGDRLSTTLLLAPVVTPRYVRSKWCRGELKEFCRTPRSQGDVRNHSRIFKIVKTQVPEEQLPEELRGVLGYDFYELDEKNRPREFRHEITPNKDQRYWDKLDDLAWDIKDAIEQLDLPEMVAPDAAANNALPLEQKVYLAETAPELRNERDHIRRELQQHNYYVLPDNALPSNPADLIDAVRGYLSRCAISIHLVGGRFDEVSRPSPLKSSGEDQTSSASLSLVQLQLDVAAEHTNGPDGFARLVWLPPGLETEDSRQRHFIDELQKNIGASTELLQTSLQDLKLRVIERLTNTTTKESKASERRRVYLINDNRDVNDIRPIGDFLYDHGFEVIPAVFEGDSAEVAQYHRESLLNCDAALIYYGSTNQMWLRSKVWDLQKLPGWGRRSPLLSAVYVSSPRTDEKEGFRSHDVSLVIQNFNGFSPDSLKPLLQALEGSNGAQKQ